MDIDFENINKDKIHDSLSVFHISSLIFNKNDTIKYNTIEKHIKNIKSSINTAEISKNINTVDPPKTADKPKPFKIAFLFLTRESPNKMELWRPYFNQTNSKFYNIYIHPKVTNINQYMIKHIIKNRIQTQWGHISLVKATILLLKEAMRDKNNKKFILLSESCIPVTKFSKLYNFCNNNLSYFFYFNARDPNSLKRFSQMSKDSPFRKDKYLKQSQWMLLDREAVDIILRNDMTKYFGKSFAPDEHYFINLLYLKYKKFGQNIKKKRITYINLENRTNTAHPNSYKYLNKNHIITARKSGCFFMRKIEKKCIIHPQMVNFILS